MSSVFIAAVAKYNIRYNNRHYFYKHITNNHLWASLALVRNSAIKLPTGFPTYQEAC